jgi:hypothetical protein
MVKKEKELGSFMGMHIQHKVYPRGGEMGGHRTSRWYSSYNKNKITNIHDEAINCCCSPETNIARGMLTIG